MPTQILIYVVLPLWIAAGFADYLCHRATDIEHANGAAESSLHWIMQAEIGVPLLAAVFLKIDALVMIFMIACWIAHEITTHIDLQLAIRTRKVTAFEQQVHSFLEVLPFAALLLIGLAHWPQALALLGLGDERADFCLALAQPPSWRQLAVPGAAILLFAVLPYADELWRGLRAAAKARQSRP